ncbi:ABC transporter ATP-binding protein [Bacillus spongiae]|uniref:ABC transporter ATP-binding protein n=1 Tax=Bacillus spongiae TaxID=2683610 RepID=A0ABU8HJG5_9BACI
MTAYVQLQDVTKVFRYKTILQQISITIQKGEILALVGPSGTGKSTLLRCITGLESFDSGRVFLDGKEVHKQKPQKREMGMVFQQALLFPHLTVIENVMYGLRLKINKQKAKKEARYFLEKVGLVDFVNHYPNELSGGQQQRVALARSLILKPKLLLLDEPFSSLDPDLRLSMRDWVHQLLKAEDVTAIFVTHDLEEAMVMGDRIGILHEGRLQQMGSSKELYEQPKNPFVATFFSEKWVINEQQYVNLPNVYLTKQPKEGSAIVELGEAVVKGYSIQQGQEIIHLDCKNSYKAHVSLVNPLNERVNLYTTLYMYTNQRDVQLFNQKEEG